MRTLTISLIFVVLGSCQNQEDRLIKEYVRQMWIHEDILTDRTIERFVVDSALSSEAQEVIRYVDAILDHLNGLDANQAYTFAELDKMDSLLDFKTNTIEFYGTEYLNPKTEDYSVLNLKLKLIAYLNLKENKEISGIIFPEFKDGKFQSYDEWTWEAKTFFNIPLIQLMVKLKEIKLKVYQIERIKLKYTNR